MALDEPDLDRPQTTRRDHLNIAPDTTTRGTGAPARRQRRRSATPQPQHHCSQPRRPQTTTRRKIEVRGHDPLRLLPWTRGAERSAPLAGRRSGRTHRYDDILEPELRGDLAVWQAATGVNPDDRSLAGPVPDDDHEAAFHRHLVRTINARYGDALKVWQNRITDYAGSRDEHTTALVKRLDELQRRGINAEQMLNLASARQWAEPRDVSH